MATDAQSLLAQAACYDCNGAPGQIQLMKLSLLAQILTALSPMADTSPQGLLNQAACYNCYGSGGMWQLMELALLAQIANNGTGGGATVCIKGGVGAPGALAIPCAFSVYVQLPGPNYGLWLGDQTSGTWSAVIAQGP